MKTDGLYDLFESRRLELGLKQADVGRIAFGNDKDTSLQNIRRGSVPSFEKVIAIAEALGLQIEISPRRIEEGPEWADMDTFTNELVKHLGVAQCGIQGWANEQHPLDPLPIPVWATPNDVFWVSATGQSMVPEGIDDGDVCLVSSNKTARPGDRVYIEDVMGALAIKRLLKIDNGTATFRGWLPLEGNNQDEFIEERPVRAIVSMYPVLASYTGTPGVDAKYTPDPRNTALIEGATLSPVSALSLNTAAKVDQNTLKIGFQADWLYSQGIKPENAALVEIDSADMAPTINKGAIALLDRRVTKIASKHIYLVEEAGHTIARRLEELPDGTIVLTADNPATLTSIHRSNDASELTILGELRWINSKIEYTAKTK